MRVDDVTLVVVDCETTGLDPAKDQVVEIAAVATSLTHPNLGMFTTFVRPTIAIPPEVRAVHHITDAELAKAPYFDDAIDAFAGFIDRASPNAKPVIVAHNAEFDREFLPLVPAWPWLCTKRLAMHLYPQAPNHRNQTLRYYLDVDIDTLGLAPHRALADALVTAAVARKQLRYVSRILNSDLDLPETMIGLSEDSVGALIEFSESPALLLQMPLGKHRGPIVNVPTDYLQWALSPRGMTDMSKDLRFTIETELAKRAQEAA